MKSLSIKHVVREGHIAKTVAYALCRGEFGLRFRRQKEETVTVHAPLAKLFVGNDTDAVSCFTVTDNRDYWKEFFIEVVFWFGLPFSFIDEGSLRVHSAVNLSHLRQKMCNEENRRKSDCIDKSTLSFAAIKYGQVYSTADADLLSIGSNTDCCCRKFVSDDLS